MSTEVRPRSRWGHVVLAAVVLSITTTAGTRAEEATAAGPADDVSRAPMSPSVLAVSDPDSLDAVHIVLDISSSMIDADPNGRVKLEGAKSALLEFLKGVSSATAIGLRTFPDPGGVRCGPGTLRYPVERQSPEQVSASIRSLQANGDTPTAEALAAAADDIRRSGFPGATIVLVSDGESNCAPPCDVAREIVKSGLSVQVITVGFRTSLAGSEELKCIASTTGGRYLDIEDGEQLTSVFEGLAVPDLSIDIDHPAEVVAEVGFEGSGVVTVRASVRNDGQIPALDTQVRLEFDGPSPGLVAPVRLLGNIAAQSESAVVSWSFRPGLLFAGQTISFAVVVRAKNVPSDIGISRSVRVRDPSTADEAGEVLRGRRLAILGDSYSSGEGADVYLDGTDTSDNACHRSRATYAVETFGIVDEAILACSGALAIDVSVPNSKNSIPSQVDQLRRLQNDSGPVDAVLLTLGGNDAGFSKIAEGCLIGDCTTSVEGEPTADFLARKLLGLPNSLIYAYQDINATLNSNDAVKRRGGAAPILVLGYPRPVPSVFRNCRELLAVADVGQAFDSFPYWLSRFWLEPGVEVAIGFGLMFSGPEIEFIHRFVTELNGIIEGAVTVAREDRGIPVFFVPNVEDSFMPDHTVCDPQSYARGLLSINGASLDLQESFADFVRRMIPLLAIDRLRVVGDVAMIPLLAIDRLRVVGDVAKDVGRRSFQELLHPNTSGYDAMTRALIRWSTTSEAGAIPAFLASTTTQPVARTCSWDDARTTELTDTSQLLRATRCALYRIVVTDAAPGSTIEVFAESTPRLLATGVAEDDGSTELTFGFPPDLPPGSHTLRVLGVDTSGARFDRTTPVELTTVDDTFAMISGIVGAALLLNCGVLVVFGRRARRAGRRQLEETPGT